MKLKSFNPLVLTGQQRAKTYILTSIIYYWYTVFKKEANWHSDAWSTLLLDVNEIHNETKSFTQGVHEIRTHTATLREMGTTKRKE